MPGRSALAILGLLLVAPAARAEDPFPPQGHFRTRIPRSLPRAAWELTTGVSRVEGARPPFFTDAPGFVRDAWEVDAVDLAYGLGAGAEVRLEGGAQRFTERAGPRTGGVQDARVSVSWEFPTQGFRAAGSLIVKLPNASDARRLGTDQTDVTLLGSAGYATHRSGWAAHLGLAILGHPAAPATQDDLLAFGLAGWLRPGGTGSTTIFAEIEGHAASRFGNDVRIGGAGILIGSRVPVGLALRHGLTSVSPDWSLDVKITLPPR